MRHEPLEPVGLGLTLVLLLPPPTRLRMRSSSLPLTPPSVRNRISRVYPAHRHSNTWDQSTSAFRSMRIRDMQTGVDADRSLIEDLAGKLKRDRRRCSVSAYRVGSEHTAKHRTV